MALRQTGGSSVPKRTINTKQLLLQISDELDLRRFSAYLFGSRKDRTGSIRSDIDLLLVSDRPLTSEHAQRIWDIEPYLDVFEVTNGAARSLVNDSRLRAADLGELIEKLGAVPLFIDGDWQTDSNDLVMQEVLGERSPAATIMPLYDLYDAVPAEHADILVVTALTEEYKAVLDKLKPGHDVRDPVARIDIGGWLITLRNLNEMGSVGAALGTRDAIVRTKASHVVLVGICAGIPRKVNLGDVVIPKSIIYFESAKRISGGRERSWRRRRAPRPGFEERSDEQRQCDVGVRDKAAMYTGNLAAAHGVVLHAGDGVMACGEKVVADKKFRDEQIRVRHRKIIAIDMESYGVARAAEGWAGRRLTVIKGVCDFADSHKDDAARPIALGNAAQVLSTMISGGAFRTG